jgi:hypothetical protein
MNSTKTTNNEIEEIEEIDISSYTDKELFQLLDLNSPTDRELEAKIHSLINKTANNEVGNKLYKLYVSIFNHFFENDEDNEEYDENEEDNNNNKNNNFKEGFDNAATTPLFPIVTASSAGHDAATTTYTPPPPAIPIIKPFEYSQGSLNPLLKETIKRVVSIDSSFRDTNTYKYTTDFTFNLSETLHDVVSLKLYSIHIPYNWYIVNQNYGSNFFYLKGVSNGINNGYFDYKISIPYGNYTAPQLVSFLNNSMTTIKNGNTDVSFGTTAVSYNEYNGKCSVTMDIKNTFNETNYYLYFPYITREDPTNPSETKHSIPELLGYRHQNYNPFSVYSSLFVSNVTPLTGTYSLTDTNNSIKIYIYAATVSSSTGQISSFVNTTTTPPLSTITVTLSLATGNTYSPTEIITDLNTQLANNTDILQSYDAFGNQVSSMIVLTDESINVTNGHKYNLIVRPNRKSPNVSNIPNQKMVVVFPDVDTSIWTGSASCFNFPSKIMEMQNINSEIQSSTTTYIVKTTPFMVLKCNAMGFGKNPSNNNDVILNDYTVAIANSPAVGYSLTQYYAAIQSGLDALKTATSGQFVGTINNTNTNSYTQISFTINNVIGQNNFEMDLTGSFLADIFNFPTTINCANGTYTTTFSYSLGYGISTANNIFIINPASTTSGNNRYMSPVPITVNAATYTLSGLVDYLNNSIFNTYTANNLNLSGMSITYQIIGGQTVNMLWNVNVQAVLKNSDYELYLFDTASSMADPYVGITTYAYNGMLYYWYQPTDPIPTDVSGNSWLNNFGFLDPSYSLIPTLPTQTTTTVMATKSVQSNLLYLDNSNNYFNIIPLYDASGGAYTDSNTITLTLDDLPINNYYTKETVRNSINAAFAANSMTAGSYVNTDNSTTLIRLNVNKIYTAKDYSLVFFDTNSFTRCNYGPNASVETTTTDTTVGWTLGFRSATEYFPTAGKVTHNSADPSITYYGQYSNYYTYDTATGIATITGDTSVNVNLYNYFLIVLDDYTQNHLNDGLVTTINADLDVALPSYATKSSYKCNPTTGTYSVSNTSANTTSYTGLTNNQIYSANQILTTQQTKYIKNTRSSGPFIQDIFGIIPVKTAGLSQGQTYTEFGGTLQIQERIYFGPVNIRRMTVKLMTDKGNILDLNGQNWSFSLITEQLYNQGGT